jgi:PAS domain S-box-containing protein
MEPEVSRVQEVMRQSDERYGKLLASVTDYIYTVRLQNGVVVETSHGPGCLAVTGYTPQQYAQDPDLWHRMVHPDDTAAVVANAAEMSQGKVPPTIEHRIFHRDGSVRWVRNQRVPYYDPSGNLAGYDGLVSDVTQRKIAEERLTATNARLREVLASLTKSHAELKATQIQLIEAEKLQTVGQLAAGVAHEVKNPLAVLQMGLSYLERHLSTTDGQNAAVVKEMGDAINRASAVVGDLLGFAAPDDLELKDRELEPLLRRSLTLVRHELNASKVKVTTNIEGPLPQSPLDRNRIKQVFVNLLTNACHAMPDGGEILVHLFPRQITPEDVAAMVRPAGTPFKAGDEVVVVEIADTGTGISPEHLSRIFDPYFTTKTREQGTGLGLTVTKTIIDMHGGHISISNRPGGGAIVTIVLKARPKDEKR